MLPELQQIIDKVTRYGTKQIGHAQGQTRAQGDALLGVANIMGDLSQTGMKESGANTRLQMGIEADKEKAKLASDALAQRDSLGVGAIDKTPAQMTSPQMPGALKPPAQTVEGSGGLLQNYTQGGVGAQPNWWTQYKGIPTTPTTSTTSNIE